jgi:protein-S-isoprenylcysteine O-methyltransferase Ste14
LSDNTDKSNAVIRPPIAWALALLIGLGIDRLLPLPFLGPSFPTVWVGAVLFILALALAIWAIRTISVAGSRVETTMPTTTIVATGPFAFTRNPIYLGMFIGLIGLAIAFNSLWVLIALLPFYAIIRYGVVAREETYLERKFGPSYLGYKSRVRRWV